MTWKEQMTTVAVPDEGLVLEAVWQAGSERAAVVAPPHPLYGGSLDNPVCNDLAHGLYRAGWASLRFNWRGVGASQGSVSGEPGDAERDYRAALDHVAETIPPPTLAAGYSWGAVAALRVGLADARVGALVLVSPPVAMLAELPLEDFSGPLHAIAGANDEFAPKEGLSEQLARAPRGHLELIPGADHFFSFGGLAELAKLARLAGESCAAR